jgi:hypothetical protein
LISHHIVQSCKQLKETEAVKQAKLTMPEHATKSYDEELGMRRIELMHVMSVFDQKRKLLSKEVRNAGKEGSKKGVG